MGKTSSTVKNRYNAKAYDQIPVRVPKGRKADVEAYAKSQGESVNGLINNFLRNAIGLSESEWKKTLDDEMDEIIEENIEALKKLAE
jgi:hypothetical protein